MLTALLCLKPCSGSPELSVSTLKAFSSQMDPTPPGSGPPHAKLCSSPETPGPLPLPFLPLECPSATEHFCSHPGVSSQRCPCQRHLLDQLCPLTAMGPAAEKDDSCRPSAASHSSGPAQTRTSMSGGVCGVESPTPRSRGSSWGSHLSLCLFGHQHLPPPSPAPQYLWVLKARSVNFLPPSLSHNLLPVE